MNIKRLRYFISVAEHLSFTSAAKKYYIAQSAMSQQIQKLEDEIGAVLFVRDPKGISLTMEGRTFLKDARIIVNDYDKARQKLKSLKVGYKGVIKISFISPYEMQFLPDLAYEFNKIYPNIELKFHICPISEMLHDLEYGDTDIILSFPYEFENQPNMEIVSLYQDSLSIIMRKDYPLAGKKDLSIKDLVNERIFMVSKKVAPNNFMRMQEHFKLLAIEPQKIEQVQSVEIMVLMVETGAGVTVVPSHIKNNVSDNILFIPVEDHDNVFIHEIAAIYLKSRKNELVNLFLETARNYFVNIES